MNMKDEIAKIKAEGYNEANAEARLCQDIILKAIAESSFRRNVTIKGGVVMRNLSGSARRATQDIDLDFIRYSISDEALLGFVEKLNQIPGIILRIKPPIQELNHQDYNGKRILVDIEDEFGYHIESKVDIGIHKDLDIRQEEYCFDICFQEEGASLLMNSREQIITEKLKSLLRFGVRNTRYKDVFDIYYLKEGADGSKLVMCMGKYIFADNTLKVFSLRDVINRLERVFQDTSFVRAIEKSKKNWLGLPVRETLEGNLSYFRKLEYLEAGQ